MVVHWYRQRGRGWTRRFALNLVGATATGFVFILVLLTRFTQGAWIVLVLMPLFILMFRGINRHYLRAAAELASDDTDSPTAFSRRSRSSSCRSRTSTSPPSMRSTTPAPSRPKIVGVHVTDDAEEAAHLQEKWEKWGEGVNLVILESPTAR